MKIHLVLFLLLLFFPGQGLSENTEDPHIKKIRVAVLPFNNLQSKTLDLTIAGILNGEFSKQGFIEMTPVEVIEGFVYEIEPSHFLTERKDGAERGDILWRIEGKTVEKVRTKFSADFSIYGDLINMGNRWSVNAYIVEGGKQDTVKSFTVTASSMEELSDKIGEMSKGIVGWLEAKNAINEAEWYMRGYMGRIYTYAAVLEKIRGLTTTFPESLPIHAILLELYSKKEGEYQDETIKVGLKVIDLYDPLSEEDGRYLLSLNIDPFDVTASVYEEKRDWERAIEVRKKALALFPYRQREHKEKLGEDYYHLALSLEEKGERKKAIEHYRNALHYLPSSSDKSGVIKERLERDIHPF